MDDFLFNFFLPCLIIAIIAGLYIWFLRYRRKHRPIKAEKVKQVLPKSAPIVPYYDSVLANFHQALKQALPEKYIIYNVPIEKLFDQTRRASLQMEGQYADFVIFTPQLMPVLVIDLFDMSIINLDRVNRIKNVSKEILRNSGIPVLDYQYTDNCNIDELRRKIAILLNPLSAK